MTHQIFVQEDGSVEVTFSLNDLNSGKEEAIKGHVKIGKAGIGVHFEGGYGEATALPEFSYPVWIEVTKDPRVCVWDDINDENAYIISLEDAKEELRQ